MKKRPCTIAAAVAFVASLLHAGCAGYQVGNDTLFRPDIRTVYVPIFQSSSFRRQLGERLTEAVVKRIERTTPYKVVHTPNADSVLTGRIVSDTKRIITEDAFDEGRDVEVALRVEVSWTDRAGRLIGDGFAQPLAPVLFIGGTGHFVPEAGQSLATAQRNAIDRLAKQIVEQMEMPW